MYFIAEIAIALTSGCPGATITGSSNSRPTANMTVVVTSATAVGESNPTSSFTTTASSISTSRTTTGSSTTLAAQTTAGAPGSSLKLHVGVALVSVLVILNLLG